MWLASSSQSYYNTISSWQGGSPLRGTSALKFYIEDLKLLTRSETEIFNKAGYQRFFCIIAAVSFNVCFAAIIFGGTNKFILITLKSQKAPYFNTEMNGFLAFGVTKIHLLKKASLFKPRHSWRGETLSANFSWLRSDVIVCFLRYSGAIIMLNYLVTPL